MPVTGPEQILFEKRGRVALLTVNRPERMNSLSFDAMDLIAKAEAEFAHNDNLWILVITGAGDRAFSAGMDLKDFAERRARGEVPGVGGGMMLGATEHYKPVIAAINGIAYGGGCELSLMCDIRIASEQARFGLPEVKRGLVPGFGVYSLPRTIDRAWAMYLCTTGNDIDAREALRIGLVHHVVPHDQLLDFTFQFAENMADNGPFAVRAAKQMVKVGSEMTWAQAEKWGEPLMQAVMGSHDAQEGATAFAEKRKPQWKGR